MADKRADENGSGVKPGFYWLLGALAVAGVAFLLFMRGGGGGGPDLASIAALDVSADSSAMAAVRGDEDAPVTLVEFADYTCPHCATFASLPAPAIQRDYVRSGQVRWVFYDFPLSDRSNAIQAAVAARCAGEQGTYWQMHDLLFARQGEWTGGDSPRGHFEEYAGQVGLDVGEWEACYEEGRHLDEIVASRKYGRELGVRGTPTVFVNGERASDYRYSTLQSLIEEELESSGSGSGGAGGAAGGSGAAGG